MPTIDQLAPATAAADGDELLVSQSGIARKATRSQILAGVQPQLAISTGTLLGRHTTGIGAPEQINVGTNLSLINGTLSAAATPFNVTALTAGLVPAAADLVPLGQNGANTAVTYSQFMSGVASLGNIDASQLLVTPTGSKSSTKLGDFAASTLLLSGGTLTGSLTLAADPSTTLQAATKKYVDTQVATTLPRTGGALSGALTLAADPSSSLQAATKQYVDTQVSTTLPKTGGNLSGALTLAGDPTSALQSATKQYVDGQIATALPKAGGNLTGTLTLAADPATSLQAATKQYVDARISRTGDTLTGALVLASDPTALLQAATKQYVDVQIATTLPKTGGALSGALTLAGDPTSALQSATKQYVDGQVATALPRTGGTLTGGLTLASDPATPLQAAPKQYVDGRVLRNGDTLTGALTLAADPAAPLQAATKQYVDARVSRSGDTLTGALVLAGDPTALLQAATKQYVDSRVARSGDTLTGALVLPGDPTAPFQAATKNYVDSQVGAALPKSGGTLSGSLTLAADPASSMQAATKRYVDTQAVASLPIAGGTLTGPLTLPANPTSALQASPKQYVDNQVAGTLPLAGGSLTGALTLAADPTSSLHAATKRYVDANTGAATGVINIRSAPYNAQLNGVTDDTAAFKAAYQAAPAGSVIYVPNGVTVLQNPGSWGIPLTKRVKWVVDGTTLPDGTALANAIPGGGSPANNYLPGIVDGNSGQSVEFSQTGSQPTDFAVQHTSYIVNHTGGPTGGSVIANARNDTIIYGAPNNFVWGGIDRLLWCGSQTPIAANTAEHVGRYVQTIRQNIGLDGSGKALPQPNLWAACLEYRDTTGQPSSMAAASTTIEMDWFGNGPDDGYKRQIQSLVVGQNSASGAPVEVSTVVGVYLGAGSAGHVYQVFNVCIPFSVSAFDTTSAQQMAGASAIRLASGHSIAFEPSNMCRLSYDSSTNTLRWYQGTLSYPVGKGITVGWLNVYGGNATLPNYITGNMIFLVGNGSPYTITLPAASTVAAGTGFTFSGMGAANVTIATTGSDAIDGAPVILRANDRYHVVSDGSSTWREIFRCNAVNPHFSAPPVLPSYAATALPGSPGAGAKAFASNGRKPNEGAGAGTGVEVFYDGRNWISVCSGSPVAP